MNNNKDSFLTVEVGIKGIWGVGELHSDIEEYLKSEVAQTFHQMVIDDGLSLKYEFKSGYDKVHKRIFILDGGERVDEVHGFNEFITDLMPEVFGKIGKYRLNKKLTEGNPVNMVSQVKPRI